MVYLEENKDPITVDNYVKVIADVNALAGTKGRLSLHDISSGGENVVGMREFPRQDEHRHTCNIPLNKLLVGSYLVRYLLHDVCWSISSFEVVS